MKCLEEEVEKIEIYFHKFSSLFRLFLFFASARVELMKSEHRWTLSTFISMTCERTWQKKLDNMRNNAIIIRLMLSFEGTRTSTFECSWNVENEEESQKSFNFILSEIDLLVKFPWLITIAIYSFWQSFMKISNIFLFFDISRIPTINVKISL